jgi:hypothetical protein
MVSFDTMAMMLRLDDDVEAGLTATAARTGRPKTRLVNEALRRALAEAPGPDFDTGDWRIPPRVRWSPPSADYLIHGSFDAETLAGEQRDARHAD